MEGDFGRYQLAELIARGGMGEVYRAYDTEHDRVVAIKLLAGHAADDEDFRRRFTRESRAAARLREPHVIPIHAYGEIDGRLYLDMRLVEGDDLSTTLANQGPLTPGFAVDVLNQIAAALDAAHADDLVHRDVKPSNVLVDKAGFAYLVDFGIARALASNADITGAGIPIGTVAYMAPERFKPGPVDHRVDVYSLACLLFQCLTGSLPFPDGNALAQMNAHLNTEPPRPTAHRPDLPQAFDQVIAVGMAKDPAQRFASAGDLAAAARHALTSPPHRLPPHQPHAHQTPSDQAPPHQSRQPQSLEPQPFRPAPLPGRPDTLPAPTPPRRGWLIGVGLLVAVALAGAAALIWLPNWDDGTATAPTTTTTTTTTEQKPPSEDLSLSTPMSNPDCDGSYIVVVASAAVPSEYEQTVQNALNTFPDANYLHAPTTGCSSLRHQLDDNDIYSVYYGPFATDTEACTRRADVGGDSFVRRLDNTSTPDRGVGCG